LPRLPTDRKDAIREAIRYFGLPAAVIISVVSHGRAYGLSVASFLDATFAVVLLGNLLVVGLGGGALFGLLMWWMVVRLTGGDQ
jgi:hypothetical protein